MATPFLAKGERITPRAARQFAKLARSARGRVLYRVYATEDSARVSAYNCGHLNVFDGLKLKFTVDKVSPQKYGVFGEPITVQKQPTRKAPAKKAVTRKAPAKKAVTRKAPAKKAVTRRAPRRAA